jgi:hypothetical protein
VSGEVGIDEIFLIQRDHANRLESISFCYKQEFKNRKRAKDGTISPLAMEHVYSNKFLMEGSKYYIETGMEGTWVHDDVKNIKVKRIGAYDNNKYQMFDKRSLELSVQNAKRNPKDTAENPLIFPYDFLFADRKPSLEEIKMKNVWGNAKERVIDYHSEIVDGNRCIVVEFEGFANEVAKVYFSQEYAYYPVKYQVFDHAKTMIVETVASHLQRCSTVEREVVIPLNVVVRHWDSTGTGQLFEWGHYIDPNTLTVNEDIPDDVFTIPLHLARSFEDVDDRNKTFSLDRVLDQSLDDLLITSNDGAEAGISNPGEVEEKKRDNATKDSNEMPSEYPKMVASSKGKSPVLIVLASVMLIIGVASIILLRRRSS